MSTPLIVLTNVLWAALVAVLLIHVQRERAARKARNAEGRRPVPSVPLEEFEPLFRPGPHGPGLHTEVAFIGHGTLRVPGGTSDFEGWVLTVLAKRARLLFEFGTCTGKTAYLWARNSPPDAKVVTVTLGPEDVVAYHDAADDHETDRQHAMEESVFTSFLYDGTEVAHKVEQLFSDSKMLDVSPWAGQCDLVFVDGSHAHSYVLSDSAKALQLVRSGGIILWHDYVGPAHSPGVYSALNELVKQLPLVHISGTTFVAYRRS